MERKIVLWALAITIPVVLAVTALALRHPTAPPLVGPATTTPATVSPNGLDRGYGPTTPPTAVTPSAPPVPPPAADPATSSRPDISTASPAPTPVPSAAPSPDVTTASTVELAPTTQPAPPAPTATPTVPPAVNVPPSIALVPVTLPTVDTDPPSNPGSGTGYFTDGIDATECAAHDATISFFTPNSRNVTRQVNATGWMTISAAEPGGGPSAHGWTFSWGFRGNGTCYTIVNEF